MIRRILVGGGAAALLSAGVLIGGLTTGIVGAQPAQRQVQAAPLSLGGHVQDAPDTGSSGGEADTSVSLPAGSISQAQAEQVATAYVQQTAPYSSMGLTFHHISLDGENGTPVYDVSFTNANGADVSVKVSTSGQVLRAHADQSGPDSQSGA